MLNTEHQKKILSAAYLAVSDKPDFVISNFDANRVAIQASISDNEHVLAVLTPTGNYNYFASYYVVTDGVRNDNFAHNDLVITNPDQMNNLINELEKTQQSVKFVNEDIKDNGINHL